MDIVEILKALWGHPDALDEESMGKFADAAWFLKRDHDNSVEEELIPV